MYSLLAPLSNVLFIPSPKNISVYKVFHIHGFVQTFSTFWLSFWMCDHTPGCGLVFSSSAFTEFFLYYGNCKKNRYIAKLVCDWPSEKRLTSYCPPVLNVPQCSSLLCGWSIMPSFLTTTHIKKMFAEWSASRQQLSLPILLCRPSLLPTKGVACSARKVMIGLMEYNYMLKRKKRCYLNWVSFGKYTEPIR